MTTANEWAAYLDAYGLTIKEAKLFAVLADGQVRTKFDLFDQVWGKGHFASDNIVAVHIDRMRKKLVRHGLAVKSVRPYGYQLVRTNSVYFAGRAHLAPSKEQAGAA